MKNKNKAMPRPWFICPQNRSTLVAENGYQICNFIQSKPGCGFGDFLTDLDNAKFAASAVNEYDAHVAVASAAEKYFKKPRQSNFDALGMRLRDLDDIKNGRVRIFMGRVRRVPKSWQALVFRHGLGVRKLNKKIKKGGLE